VIRRVHLFAAGSDIAADGGVVVMGAIAYKQLAISALPEVDYPTIQVLTFYPEASPMSQLRPLRASEASSDRCRG